MRSGSFSWLLNTSGIKAHTLKGGYKAYRNFALDYFSGLDNLILLGGETGSGKTSILKELKEVGEQVVDLEALAHHKGSSFGGISGINQPTNEQFQNNLLKEIMQLDISRKIWLEDESHNIGSVRMPDALWFKMRSSPVVRLVISKEARIARLVEDYGNIDKDLLSKGIIRISKKIGGLETSNALQLLEANKLWEVADICLNYYDKAYKTGLRHRNPNLICNLDVKEGEHLSVQDIVTLAAGILACENNNNLI